MTLLCGYQFIQIEVIVFSFDWYRRRNLYDFLIGYFCRNCTQLEESLQEKEEEPFSYRYVRYDGRKDYFLKSTAMCVFCFSNLK